MKTRSLVLSLLSLAGLVGASHGALISLNFSGSMTPAQQQAFVDAANYWNAVITGYDQTKDINGNTVVHSLVISASVAPIDGVGGTLGSAGPTSATPFQDIPGVSPNQRIYYANQGNMQFDDADVTNMLANGSFYGVVLHEMAHVLGIGTLWDFNTANGIGVNLYTNGSGQYLGAAALAAWQTEFNQPGATFVPVELGGGAGTANAHWNENDNGTGTTGITSNLTGDDFANELMTGWANSPFFISTVTLGSLDDLGYIVDYNLAGELITIPEPGSLALSGLALATLLLKRRR